MSVSQNESENISYGKIILKRLKESDATEEYNNWLNDKEITKYLCTKSSTVEDIKNFIKSCNQNQNIDLFGIFDLNNIHIGNVKLENVNSIYNIGIMIGKKEYHNKGYGYDAMKACINYFFKNYNEDILTLGVDIQNIQAIKCYEKLGFIKDDNSSYSNAYFMHISRNTFKSI